MVFSSLPFTFFFLPLVLGLYFLAKERYRNYLLLVASLLFYAYGEPRFIFAMLASVLVNYGMALLISREERGGVAARVLLTVTVVLNSGLLFWFKYLDFSISIVNQVFGTGLPARGIALPIGISFFTFQALSYVIDVYRGTVPVQKNLCYVALYISFFPQLIAGPIVRYSSIEKQISERKCTVEGAGEGIRRFFLGFCKKILLANNLGVVSSAAFGLAGLVETINPLFLWMASICYSLQIYYDFSGYSDMAIGLGKMFGFAFEENFNYPYISRSVTEFWRRWHISLGQWFRDYVYIPLGGSRVAVPRHLLNMLVVWGLTGIWHGANLTFVVWGLWYFALLAIEKYIIKPERRKFVLCRIIWQAVTLVCVNFGWVMFNSADVVSGIRYCLAMLGFYGTVPSMDGAMYYYGREYGFFLVVGLLFATPIMKVLAQWADRNDRVRGLREFLSPVCYGVIFLWSVSFLILGAHNPFIYFDF